MYYLHCLFDHRRHCPKPLFAVSFNVDNKDVQFYQLYLSGTKLPLSEVNDNINKIIDLLNKEDVILSDFHSYIRGFNLDINRRYEVWDVSATQKLIPDSISVAKKMLLQDLSKIMEYEQLAWQQILANSQLVYSHLENLGYYFNGAKKFPKYRLAYTGRSRCLDSNIQGTGPDDEIHHSDDSHEVFIHFDWVAADFRVASLISKDKFLQDSFKKSDPYKALSEALNVEEITREHCKLELFRSLYSMNHGSDVLEFYPEFAKWMQVSSNEIEQVGYSSSILGRHFKIDEEHPIRSAFNAQVQGSVAHAMQSVLYRVFKMYPDNLLAEIHDSLILCCNKKDLKPIIEEVANIMLFPFDDILEENPKFPLKVSVGYQWKKWQPYKEYR